MTEKIITISRQFGSGGRTIGHHLSEKLGIPCYDSQLLKKIAAQSGLSEAYVAKEAEKADSAGFFSFAGETDFYGYSNKLEIWKAQCQILKDLASQGPCIIVGRCADYVLREQADLLKVFVYADFDFRKERSLNVYKEGVENVEKYVKDNDKRRRAYYDVYTDMKFGDARNYDICLNSSTIGIEKCADIIADLYKAAE